MQFITSKLQLINIGNILKCIWFSTYFGIAGLSKQFKFPDYFVIGLTVLLGYSDQDT